MILCIDIGNTNIKVAIFTGDAPAERPLHVWRISSDTKRTADEYAGVLTALISDFAIAQLDGDDNRHCDFYPPASPVKQSRCTKDAPCDTRLLRAVCHKQPARNDGRPSAITRSAISSVVPALTGVFCTVCKALTGSDPTVISAGLPLPVTLPDTARHEIGTDLLCDAVEVWSRCRGNCIVCDAGTALSFVAVSSDGEIAGVAIAPGINTAMASLVGGTAQLYSVPLALPPSSLGQNTTEALQSGVVLGYTHLVRGLVGQMKSDLAGGGQCTTFATGGLQKPIGGIFDVIDPDITICGLYRIAMP